MVTLAAVSGGSSDTPSAQAALIARVLASVDHEVPLEYMAALKAQLSSVCVVKYSRAKSSVTANMRVRNGSTIAISVAAAPRRFAARVLVRTARCRIDDLVFYRENSFAS
jgi:hypothetical protein